MAGKKKSPNPEILEGSNQIPELDAWF